MQDFVTEPARQIPVVAQADVVVCGGGPAGLAAALAAARAGASVVLVESYGFAGGMASAGLVRTLAGMGLNGTRIVGGFAWQMVQRLIPLSGVYVDPTFDSIALDSEAVKHVADQMLAAAGIRLLLHTMATDVVVADGMVSAVLVENKSGRGAVVGKVFIDATGDGDICARAGCGFMLGRPLDGNMLPMTLVFRLGGVDGGKLDALWRGQMSKGYHQDHIRQKMQAAYESGTLPLFGGPWIRTYGEGVTRRDQLFVNATRLGGNAADADDLTAAEIKGRHDAWEFMAFLRTQIPELADCYLAETAAHMGIRETRHFQGDYELGAEDVLAGNRPYDTIALGGHPIDIHSPDGDSKQRLVWLEKPYGIPYRCLLPKGVSNLLMAGRMVSATHEAHATLRVMGTAMAMGEAAGFAAALAAAGDAQVRGIAVGQLQAHIRDNGGILE